MDEAATQREVEVRRGSAGLDDGDNLDTLAAADRVRPHHAFAFILAALCTQRRHRISLAPKDVDVLLYHDGRSM